MYLLQKPLRMSQFLIGLILKLNKSIDYSQTYYSVFEKQSSND